jgi:hypothetical protein
LARSWRAASVFGGGLAFVEADAFAVGVAFAVAAGFVECEGFMLALSLTTP